MSDANPSATTAASHASHASHAATPPLASGSESLATTPSQRASRKATRSKGIQLAGQLSLAAPVLGLGVGTWLTFRRHGATRALGLGVLGASVGLALVRWQLARFVTETVDYEVESRVGDLEVRRYAPTVRAETTVHGGAWGTALDEGFHRVASYIFGANTVHDEASARELAAVPAPQPAQARGGEKIAMTAPVIATVGESTDAETRTVSFIMPGEHSLATLPTPDDDRVHLRLVPAQRLAALAFRGTYGGAAPSDKREELLARVREAGFTPVGEVMFAGYDAPWTLPLLRRNEVLVEIAEGG